MAITAVSKVTLEPEAAPTAELTPTIVLYKERDFKGTQEVLTEGKYPDLSKTKIGIDKLRSIRVLPGTRAVLFITRGFRDGSFVLFEGDYPDLDRMANKVDAVQVFKHDGAIFPIVKLYKHFDFTGPNQHFAGTQQVTDFSDRFLADQISSVRVPEGVTVTLFRDANQNGPSLVLEPGDYEDLRIFGFDNKVSSLRIVQSGLEVVDIEYDESSLALTPGENLTIVSSVENGSSLEQQATLSLEKTYEESFARSFENSTLVGLEVSTTASVSAGFGGAEASFAQTVTASLENTFTVGKEEAKNKSITVTKDLSLTVPPGKILKASMVLTPKQGTITVTYTLRLKGTKLTTKQRATIETKTASVGEVKIEEVSILPSASLNT